MTGTHTVRTTFVGGLLVLVIANPLTAGEPARKKLLWSERVQTVLDTAPPLRFSRRDRLPLYLWPASNPGNLNQATATRLVRELDQRGIGLISSWSPRHREQSLAQALIIARTQESLGLRVNVNANACMHRFFDGSEQTAHIDEAGKPFWDDSFNVGKSKRKMGCPFALDSRRGLIREQIEYFARAYHDAKVPLDFVFVDWEIDGPLELNGAHAACKRCRRCREHIEQIDNFLAFQKTLREIRSELQYYALTDPIKSRFEKALVGNYALYPHDGYRYWYDYFEYFVEGQPHLADQRARYRHWANDFAGTGFTCAMPVVYTWYPTYQWYDFKVSDYRWFYNMLLVASNAGQHTPADVPIVSFVHWHMTAPPEAPDPSVKQLSEASYQELLWHMLLRGTDTFFLWCRREEDAKEVQLVHEVYAAAQQYCDFLDNGVPVTFAVPKSPGPVVSALLLDDELLVRRTDFGNATEPVTLTIGNHKVAVECRPGEMQRIRLR